MLRSIVSTLPTWLVCAGLPRRCVEPPMGEDRVVRHGRAGATAAGRESTLGRWCGLHRGRRSGLSLHRRRIVQPVRRFSWRRRNCAGSDCTVTGGDGFGTTGSGRRERRRPSSEAAQGRSTSRCAAARCCCSRASSMAPLPGATFVFRQPSDGIRSGRSPLTATRMAEGRPWPRSANGPTLR